MGSGGCREGSLSGCIWRLPAGSLIGTAGTEATGTGYLRGFLMGALVGDLSADVAQCGYFGIKNGHDSWGRCPAGGVVEKVEKRKCCFIVFCKCYKTPNGSKKKQENKREGGNTPVLLESLAQRFIGFGESDVHPRVIQTRRIGGPGRG